MKVRRAGKLPWSDKIISNNSGDLHRLAIDRSNRESCSASRFSSAVPKGWVAAGRSCRDHVPILTDQNIDLDCSAYPLFSRSARIFWLREAEGPSVYQPGINYFRQCGA